MTPSPRALYHSILRLLPPILSLQLQHFRSTGRWPNIRAPRTFNEKILSRKLNESNELYARLSDKSAVKNYVREILGADLVIPSLWEGQLLPSTPPDYLTPPYVVKASHASGWNYFVHEQPRDWDLLVDLTKSWMSKPWNTHLHERWYNRSERKIIIEPFIGTDRTPPADIKLFVFSGKVQIIQFDSDRATDHRRDIFDRNWNLLNFEIKYRRSELTPERPKFLDEMIRLSEILAGDIPFVRIDFYETANGVKFGEMTFSPGGGIEPFMPSSFDYEIGKLWTGHIF